MSSCSNRLGRKSALEHGSGELLDMLAADGVDTEEADRRRDMDALHRFAVLELSIARR
jgi:hypothetical protein